MLQFKGEDKTFTNHLKRSSNSNEFSTVLYIPCLHRIWLLIVFRARHCPLLGQTVPITCMTSS